MALTVEIREMTLDDLDNVMFIEDTSFSSPWSRYAFEYDLIHNPHAYYFVYCLEGTITGYSGLWIFETVGHIVNMAVLEEFRRKGIAKKLLEFTLDFGRERGVERFTLEVRKSNEAAIELYRNNGFVDVGIRPRYYQDNREDAVIMWTRGKDGEVSFS
jgi:ribosomal-protein-alanine N-acetyltransferase